MQTTDPIEAAVESLLIPAEVEPVEEEQVEADAAEEETVEPEAEGDAPEVEDSGEEEAEDDDAADEPEPSKYTVKVDGKEMEVTLDELKRSFSGQAYIQKGMQEAAEAKKQATQLYEALQAEQAKLMAVVQQVQQTGFKSPPKAPDLSMLESDPIGYMAADAKYRQALGEYQQQQQQFAAVQQQQAQLQQRAMAEYIAEQAKVLQERIPEFADAKKAGEIKEKLVKTGIEAYGFAMEELEQIRDARHVQVLHDAMKWRELQAGKAMAKKAPDAPRTVKPQPRRADPAKVVRQKQLQAAKKSGRLDDFVGLMFEP